MSNEKEYNGVTKVFHPVLYDTVRRKHFLLVGSFYNSMRKRNCLCVFEEYEPHINIIEGLYLDESQMVVTSNRFIIATGTLRSMTQSQRETFNCHLLSGLIVNTISATVSEFQSGVKSKKRVQDNQLKMKI